MEFYEIEKIITALTEVNFTVEEINAIMFDIENEVERDKERERWLDNE